MFEIRVGLPRSETDNSLQLTKTNVSLSIWHYLLRILEV